MILCGPGVDQEGGYHDGHRCCRARQSHLGFADATILRLESTQDDVAVLAAEQGAEHVAATECQEDQANF